MEQTVPNSLHEDSELGALRTFLLALISQTFCCLCTRIVYGVIFYYGDRWQCRRCDPDSPPVASSQLTAHLPGRGVFWPVFCTCATLLLVSVSRFGVDQLPGLRYQPLVVTVSALTWYSLGLTRGELYDAISARPVAVGRGSCWSHYFGYLKHMTGLNRVSKRLAAHARDQHVQLTSHRLLLLLAVDGEYAGSVEDLSPRLSAVASPAGQLAGFNARVSGSMRMFGAHRLFQVKDERGGVKALVALEFVGALLTLFKLVQNASAPITSEEYLVEVASFIDELRRLVGTDPELRHDLAFVTYTGRDEIADRIIEVLEEHRKTDLLPKLINNNS